MNTAILIFPHQLFERNPAVIPGVPIYLVEEFLFFSQYKFHKQKLVLHRAQMTHYAKNLSGSNPVEYIDAREHRADVCRLIESLHQNGVSTIRYTDVVDNWLQKRITATCKKVGVQIEQVPTPCFLNSMESVTDFFDQKGNYFMADFYKQQRLKHKILLSDTEKPLGGKWSFDADNRKRFPKNAVAPAVNFPAPDRMVKEAIRYVEQNFPDNYGTLDEFHYPVTHKAAKEWLDDFLENRFKDFGVYEDAMVKKEKILHHSVLTPLLNTGLLEPGEVIERAIDTAIQLEIPLNSLEGFIRQIMGWREFIRIVYEREGSRQRTTNYWNFHRKVPYSFWTGTTGIEPVDTVIKKILKTGYCHHIERLMVLGNFMLLCEFDPDDVYLWFMEMFIDSYDWVMVPNVYGMTQFADGGLMTTKPYISGSNYLMKMSDFTKGPWQDTWDALFWRFMHVHRSFFEKNPRIGMLVKTFDKMPQEKREKLLSTAEEFLDGLDK